MKLSKEMRAALVLSALWLLLMAGVAALAPAVNALG